MDRYFNKDTLIRVDVFPAKIATSYEWQDETKFLGITIRKEGIYGTISGNNKGLTPPDGYYLSGKTVYRKPNVVLHYADGHKFYRDFVTLGGAEEYARTVMSGYPFTQDGIHIIT